MPSFAALLRLRKEAPESPKQPAAGRHIDTLILLDRAVDLVTPCCTQLTYEGLIDEVFSIVNGAVQLGPGQHLGCCQATCEAAVSGAAAAAH